MAKIDNLDKAIIQTAEPDQDLSYLKFRINKYLEKRGQAREFLKGEDAINIIAPDVSFSLSFDTEGYVAEIGEASLEKAITLKISSEEFLGKLENARTKSDFNELLRSADFPLSFYAKITKLF